MMTKHTTVSELLSTNSHFIFLEKQESFFLQKSRPTLASVQPLIQYVRDFFSGIKRPGRVGDLHLVPKIRMGGGAVPLLPPHAFMAWAGTTLFAFTIVITED
jgi:hypothetical protein